MTKTKAEGLWDWCLTEVMKLPNGKDVWEQITKVKDFSNQSVLEEVRGKMPKIPEYSAYVRNLGMKEHSPLTITNAYRKGLNDHHDQVTSLINNLIKKHESKRTNKKTTTTKPRS